VIELQKVATFFGSSNGGGRKGGTGGSSQPSFSEGYDVARSCRNFRGHASTKMEVHILVTGKPE